MKILYDHQLFSLEAMGGMSKYYIELIEQLTRDGYEVVIPLRWTNNRYLLDYYQSKGKKFKTRLITKNFKGKNNLIYRYNKFRFFLNADKILEGVDLVHMTLFDPYMIKILQKKNIPYVFTVYDLNHKTQQLKGIRMCDYADKGISQLAEHAARIICVSGQTKRDLLKYYPEIDEKKIQIIYHSIKVTKSLSHYDTKSDPSNLVTSQPSDIDPSNLVTSEYILFIGKRQADYKNFKSFIRAIAPLLSDSMKLKCLGHMEFDEAEIALFEELGIKQFVEKVGGDENAKFRLLQHCSCFVYPSLAEGFGIPILEAWNAGAPVLCSAIQVFMEIGQGAALYFDPKSEENMRELIGSVIKNKVLQDNLREAGFERVRLFDKSVEYNKTLELYEGISKLKS